MLSTCIQKAVLDGSGQVFVEIPSAGGQLGTVTPKLRHVNLKSCVTLLYYNIIIPRIQSI